MTSILTAGKPANYLTGIFYVCTLHIRRFRTPVRSVNAPAAVRWKSTGKAEPLVFSPHKFHHHLL